MINLSIEQKKELSDALRKAINMLDDIADTIEFELNKLEQKLTEQENEQ